MEIKISTITSCFKGEKYLESFLKNVSEQTILDKIEVVLVHNEPTEKEIELVRNFQEKYPGVVNHIIIKPVEPIGKSMNRCIKEAKGNYVTIWNIDDLRTPNSLEVQMKVLDENPDIGLTYGDFVIVDQIGKTTGNVIISPEFERREFTKSMRCGPFPMWRKEINKRIGYFDEQLIEGADFDLMVRIALNHKMKKNQGILGYYLNERVGLSTRRGGLQPIERTVIELRYGVYHKIDFLYYKRALKYRIYQVFFDDKWFPINDFYGNYNQLIKNRRFKIFLSLITYPLRFTQRITSFVLRRLCLLKKKI